MLLYIIYIDRNLLSNLAKNPCTFALPRSSPPCVLRALGGPVAPPLDLEGCRRFKLTVKTLGMESVQTELMQSGQIIATNPPVGHPKWWFSKGIPLKIP